MSGDVAISPSRLNMPTIIGITGQIGAGKSTAAKVFSQMGTAVINADRIGREVVEKNIHLRLKFARAFGKEVLTPNQKLRRHRVAEIAFSSQSQKRKLDRLVHPFLVKELKRQIKKLSKTNEVIVIDAALLLDWNLGKLLDKILVIDSKSEKCINRLVQRGITRSDALARQKLQRSSADFRKHADNVIVNNSSKKNFESQVRAWAKQIFNSN